MYVKVRLDCYVVFACVKYITMNHTPSHGFQTFIHGPAGLQVSGVAVNSQWPWRTHEICYQRAVTWDRQEKYISLTGYIKCPQYSEVNCTQNTIYCVINAEIPNLKAPGYTEMSSRIVSRIHIALFFPKIEIPSSKGNSEQKGRRDRMRMKTPPLKYARISRSMHLTKRHALIRVIRTPCFQPFRKCSYDIKQKVIIPLQTIYRLPAYMPPSSLIITNPICISVPIAVERQF